MKFSILLFAVLKDRAGCDRIEIAVDENEPINVAALLQNAAEQFSDLAPWLPHIRVAVNCEYARNDQEVKPEDEIAFLPPVAGG